MSLWQFVVSKTQRSLPTAEQTGIGERATNCANEEVEKVCDCGAPGEPRKRKRYTSYSKEDTAKIGQYASKNGNSAALKRFRVAFPELGVSTIRSFKNKIHLCSSGEKKAS